MGNQIRPYERRVQVLEILQEYGALSPVGIAIIIGPSVKLKKLRICLKRMEARKLIYQRESTRMHDNTPFYQLSGRTEYRQTILSILKADSTELRAPEVWFEENYHGQRVALWAHRFKHWLPTASVVCRVNFAHNDHARNTLHYRAVDRRITPDVLISVPNCHGETTNIALTVNGNLRFKYWPVWLYRSLASNPKIHGIINVTGEHHYIDELENVRRYRWRTSHSKQYGNLFFLCLLDLKPRLDKPSPMLSCNYDLVTLPDWIAHIETINTQKAAQFCKTQPAHTAPMFDLKASMGGELIS